MLMNIQETIMITQDTKQNYKRKFIQKHRGTFTFEQSDKQVSCKRKKIHGMKFFVQIF